MWGRTGGGEPQENTGEGYGRWEKEGYLGGGDSQRERRGRNWMKLGNIAQYFTIEKGLKWQRKSRKKGGENCKYKANAAGRWTLFGFCD